MDPTLKAVLASWQWRLISVQARLESVDALLDARHS